MDVLKELALRSRRIGWLSLFGALLVFISIGYSYFTIRQLNEEIESKKNIIKELNYSITKLNETRNSAAALLLDILNIEHQARVDPAVDWERFREQLLSMPSGQRQEAVFTAILLAWKDIPFNIKGKRLLEGFSSPKFIQYVLRHVGINVQEGRTEHTSDALMRAFERTQYTEPGDIVCYKGNIGNFCLLIISTDGKGKALAGIGTLETTNPLGVYAMSSINVNEHPLLGYFKVPYKN